ncbi:ATPase involved in DNA repair [Rhizoctonia solani]|uniref:ATPase involved in DNA repair n=1 Tax=Rhizoctonia solani TaxID=456999 RepID=A0A8H7M2M9_9AGAM|nr:ATPase involved in DNA repair [Rhizoctonia solani]
MLMGSHRQDVEYTPLDTSRTSHSNAPTSAVFSVAISPDGSRIAAAGEDKAIYMFNTHNGTPALQPLVAHTTRSTRWRSHSTADLVRTHDDEVNSAAFSSDGKHVVSRSDDGKIRLWARRRYHACFVHLGRCGIKGWQVVLGPLKAHQDSVMSVVFSPDGNHIVSGSADGRVGVWRVEDGAPACRPLEGHQRCICSVACSLDGAYIVSGSDDSTIRVWKTPGRGAAYDSSRSASSTSDQREPHRAIAGGLTIDSGGWARNHDLRLIFWVPSDLRKSFPAPRQFIRSGLKARFERTIVSRCCLEMSGSDVLLAESEVSTVNMVDQWSCIDLWVENGYQE